MAGSFFKRFRLVYRRSSNLLKCVVAVTIVLCIVTLATLAYKTADAKDQADALRKEAALLEEEQQQLNQQIALLGSAQSTVRIAMEQLGLVEPGTIIFEPVFPTDPE